MERTASRPGADSQRSILYALGANLAIAAAKLAGALYTGSGALLAEGLHSLADTGNQGLLLLGLRQAQVPPSVEYPLGHGRAIYFWSFVVALMLFSMGGLFSLYEGWHKLQAHEGMHAPWVAVAILGFALVAEGVSLRVALGEIGKLSGGRPLLQWFRETRRSELIVVAGEDSAALLGLTFALAAVLVTIATGDPFYDALGSMLVGALLVVVALVLGHEIKGLLIGKSASPALQRAIAEFLHDRAEIARLVELITLQQGVDVVVAVRAQMAASASPRALVEDIRRCEAALKARFPQVRWAFFEPDVAD